MEKITVGVLTVSDRCSRNEAIDESGPNLIKIIGNGVINNAEVLKTGLVSDSKEKIEKVLKDWCNEGINLILTTGGTGISEEDVTPEATAEVVNKTVPGISSLIFKRCSKVTPLAALSRGISGVCGKTLIINLPGSKKASEECLKAVAEVISHAVDLIVGRKKEIKRVHASLEAKQSSVIVGSAACRKRESPYPCVPVNEAQAIIMERIFILRKEKVVNYQDAMGYVMAQCVTAQDDLPPFDASMKDGYAVLSSDNKSDRDVIGISNTDYSSLPTSVLPGCCVRISTGAAMPPGADAVVQVEDTEVIVVKEDQEEGKIIVKKFPAKGQDIRPKGSDFKMGHLLMTTGTLLTPAAVGLLAAAGVTSVRVFDKPFVAVISTGDELIHPNEELKPGKIRDSNRVTLINLLKAEDFRTIDLGICPDNPNALRNSLEKGFREADVVVTTGSMSMGERDYLKEVLVSDFNAEVCFGRVFMKPGKPTAFAIVKFEGKPKVWFGMPGNPASAFVTSHLFLLPALRKISGHQKIFPICVRAVVDSLVHLEDRPQYVRGTLTYDENEDLWCASVTGDQRSSRIGSCINANCLLEFPRAPGTTNKSEVNKSSSSFQNMPTDKSVFDVQADNNFCESRVSLKESAMSRTSNHPLGTSSLCRQPDPSQEAGESNAMCHFSENSPGLKKKVKAFLISRYYS